MPSITILVCVVLCTCIDFAVKVQFAYCVVNYTCTCMCNVQLEIFDVVSIVIFTPHSTILLLMVLLIADVNFALEWKCSV